MLRKSPAVIQDMMHESDVTVRDLSGLAVGIGPGSYTGVRVGISFMQGLALARSLPLHGIKTPAAVAAAFPGSRRVCILQESGRRTGHVVVTFYDTTSFPPNERTAPAIILPADFSSTVDLHDALVVGPAALRVAELPGVTFELRSEMTGEEIVIPRGSIVAELAYQQHLAGAPGDPKQVDAVYLTVPPMPHRREHKA
jgi:tRNA threonylcarbamoyladenosine biosynthesis protein TsaB